MINVHITYVDYKLKIICMYVRTKVKENCQFLNTKYVRLIFKIFKGSFIEIFKSLWEYFRYCLIKKQKMNYLYFIIIVLKIDSWILRYTYSLVRIVFILFESRD